MPDGDIEQLIDRAARFIVSRQHDRAIALLTPALAANDDRRIARQLALAYGGKAEHLMERADQLMVQPSEPELRALECWRLGAGRRSHAWRSLLGPRGDQRALSARLRRGAPASRRSEGARLCASDDAPPGNDGDRRRNGRRDPVRAAVRFAGRHQAARVDSSVHLWPRRRRCFRLATAPMRPRSFARAISRRASSSRFAGCAPGLAATIQTMCPICFASWRGNSATRSS